MLADGFVLTSNFYEKSGRIGCVVAGACKGLVLQVWGEGGRNPLEELIELK